MTKLLVRGLHNTGTAKSIVFANPLDYARFADSLNDWPGWRFEIVGTDRYTLDAYHEKLRLLHFKLLMNLILHGDNYYRVERQTGD